MARKILFVDDDREWRSVVGTWLRDAGYEVVSASDATEAMVAPEGVKLDLIILDLNLAGEDGLELGRFLKRNHPGVPIILYTGQEHDYQTVHAMMQQGASRYLRKGSKEELLNSVRVFLP